MGSGQQVAVFGAYGHTGRFVVAELAARGYVPVPSGRNPQALEKLALDHGWTARVASADDPASLDRVLAGVVAVINCAGPFASTTGPVIEAALRAKIPYLDVAAELEANLDTFGQYRERALGEGAVIVPAMAFFGGLGDLLVTAAMGDWTEADEAHIAYALSSWHPTAGTRLSGAVSRERRGDHRLRYRGGKWERRTDAAPALEWTFPEPVGRRPVIGEFTMADVVTVPQHLVIPDVTTYMSAEAARDVVSPDTQAPAAADESGRSDQTFLVDAVVRRGDTERRATASGQDIYAVTAPLVAEALDRVLTGRTRSLGVVPAGGIFDAPDFLRALEPHIALDLHPGKAGA
ncbi:MULTISPECIES: saccharopine dehydrogenase family protein [Streptomyces]|uniref:Saccharopine dehydrogenase n=1 Tax=Streptomyces rubiginosohelvolus TaxID=67362 RepID=A0ABQ3BDJ4_9ACTN|nr:MULTISPECIES: saccharopine dehydrogenase NADP-binding domain-containing protein [Streptomyces]RUP70364.1 Saccharopine dehydrogenase [Streptomyces sp. NP10]GGR94125.1 saccharopine dehydrogenase [Streptomyces rubiginosohelvolus]GGZ34531.1 saccharopine dehydrogenase [Streptomyces pluricolorescens]